MTRIRIMTPEQSRCQDMTATIEYDDGEPATIAPATLGTYATDDWSLSMSSADYTERTCLAATPRDAAIDYDDGDPGTVLT